jgi:hypothetical protein
MALGFKYLFKSFKNHPLPGTGVYEQYDHGYDKGVLDHGNGYFIIIAA